MAEPRAPFFQRSGPQSRGNFAGIDLRGGNALTPIWYSSRSNARRFFDTRRLYQLLGLIVFVLIIFSLLSSTFSGSTPQNDLVPPDRGPDYNFFVEYEGGLDCRISSTDLYQPPDYSSPARIKKFPYCRDRTTMLEAINGGGRHGFDAPFTPKGCHFKWYSTTEICMILDRFDGVVFIGDEMISSIYAGFNIFLRQNLAMGALEQWKMNDKERDTCRCSNQFTRSECAKYFVSSNFDVATHDSEGGYRSPYTCNRVPHFYLPISGSPARSDLTTRFANLLGEDPHSWKPVAIIHGLGLSTGFTWQTATSSMDEWLRIADASGRNSPFLWVGPNAAGHLKPPGKILQEGNNALWHYTVEMNKEAVRRGVEGVGMYNSTLQASSYDGSHYGERVALVQAMMPGHKLAFKARDDMNGSLHIRTHNFVICDDLAIAGKQYMHGKAIGGVQRDSAAGVEITGKTQSY